MLTQEQLKKIINYNQETGIFTWTDRKHCSGRTAGGMDVKGYIIIKIYGKTYKSHRLAFLYMDGEMPEGDVDHINGIRDDNRWINLRKATRSENIQNLKKAHRSNKSTGLLGVYLNKKEGSIYSKITINKKVIYLGCFKTAEEAHKIYLTAKRELHPYGTL
jgi:hypothetical protein